MFRVYSKFYFLIFILIASAHAEETASLADLPLEDLTKLKVYSASKKNEDQLFAPSAVYVITAEDLKQMGVTNVPDALRTVPGIEVARLSSNKWMIASRGFGEQFSNKLLVLIDGRPIYSNLFSGAVWNQHDLVLDNIKQIEVIRGPGATIWGSNAVNGVINIITKDSDETLGNYANVIAGNDYKIAEYRSGHKLSEDSSLRASVKLRKEESFEGINNPAYEDDWASASANFRFDKQINYRDGYSILGNVSQGVENQLYKVPTLVAPFSTTFNTHDKFKGFYLLGKVQKGLEDQGDVSITSYVDYNQWEYVLGKFETANLNLDAQHDFTYGERQEISWGAGAKGVTNRADNTDWIIYTPSHDNAYYLNTFIQDEIAILPKKLYLNLGTKLESNSFVNFAHQPSAKLAWHVDQSNMLWASVARALRIPSLGTRNLSLQVLGTPGGYVSQIGRAYFKPEELIAYELGYKATPTTGWYVDITSYFHSYDKLRTFEPGAGFGNIFLPYFISNKGNADIYGIEFASRWQPTHSLWFSTSYSLAKSDFSLTENSFDPVFLNTEKKWPEQMFSLRASKSITDDITFNASYYYTDALPAISIKSQSKVDANLTWQAFKNTEVSIAGENLFMPEHKEYSAPLFGFSSRIGPSYYVRLTTNF